MDLATLARAWEAPVLPESLEQGDMPGDKINIGETHVRKAQVIFPQLLGLLEEAFAQNPHGRAVVAVCGGSGVGKSEIASILSHYLREAGIGSYTLSGDNYPHRVPFYNDAERLRVFRCAGLKALVDAGCYTDERMARLNALWAQDRDAAPDAARESWMQRYQQAGRSALADYLGSEKEIDFTQVGGIVSAFRHGAPSLMLKRMGREREALWYEQVDMRDVRVLVIEWTHGNSDRYQGVDIPILLNSTPAETLAHRKARGRDRGADSPFVTMVLELEQKMLRDQAHKAKIILSKAGDVMSWADYCAAMAE